MGSDRGGVWGGGGEGTEVREWGMYGKGRLQRDGEVCSATILFLTASRTSSICPRQTEG